MSTSRAAVCGRAHYSLQKNTQSKGQAEAKIQGWHRAMFTQSVHLFLSFIKALNGLAAPAKVAWKIALKGESVGTELSKDIVSCSVAATPTVAL